MDGSFSPVPSTKPLTGRAAARAEAKLAILRHFEAFAAERGLSASAAAEPFCAAVCAGEITVDPALKDALPGLSGVSLLRWRRQARQGTVRLAGSYGNRSGSGRLDSDEALRDFVVGQIAHRPHMDCGQLMLAIEARFGAPALSERTLRRWVAKWRAEQAPLLLAIANPDGWRSKHQFALGRMDAQAHGLNSVWESDVTPQDIVTLGDGRRNAIVVTIDVWSRRVKALVCPVSSGLAITAAWRRCILDWGLPEAVKTDNGKDFDSFHVRRCLNDLHVEHVLTPPYTPEAKPHVERVCGTINRFLELAPGYIGHSVADRKAIESRRSFAERREKDAPAEVLWTAEQLQAAVDQWCDGVYGRRPHDGLGGETPFARAASWTGQTRRVADERALDLLLAPAPDGSGQRVVGKKGVRVAGADFIATEMAGLAGRTVDVRCDPADMGVIYLFDLQDGQFLCRAVCPERQGVDRAAVAVEVKRRQRQIVADGRRELKRKAKQVTAEAVAQEILDAAAGQANRVVAIPRRADPAETAALAAAAAAAKSGAVPESTTLTPRQQKIRQRIATAGAAVDHRSAATLRFERAETIEAALAAGEAVGADDARWIEGYRRTAEYRARRVVVGRAAAG